MDKNITLFGDYSWREMSREEFDPMFREYRPRVFDGSFSFDTFQVMSEDEIQAWRTLQREYDHLYHLRLGIYHGSELIGWHLGWQECAAKYYMCNSGIIREHRDRGVYSAMLPVILDIVRKKGFQLAYSRHIATNNQVLVPKLKAGFIITGFELADNHGMMVHLSYHFNEKRRHMMDIRAGQRTPDEEFKQYLKL